MFKNLVILTCNQGAYYGNYFTGALWKKFNDEICASGLRPYVTFAAVDSIITLLNNDGKGAIILETEMNRVKGFDIRSTLDMFNPTKSIGLTRLNNHTKELKVGINRLFSSYDKVFVALNTEVYKMCMAAAIEETNTWNQVLFYEMLAGCWSKQQIINELKQDLLHLKRTGILKIPERNTIDQKYINKWLSYRVNIPARWSYWNWNHRFTT